MTAKGWSIAFTGLVVIATTMACTSDYPLCKAREYRACRCEDGSGGYQSCNASEDEYDVCVCGGSTPGAVVDAGIDSGIEKKGFLAACTTNDDCESNFCGSFPSRGDKCTLHCASDAECPAPSPGCNPKQMCKSP